MVVIKFNVRGKKLDWGEKIAVLRENYGVALLELNGRLEVVGGFIRYEDLRWCNGELIAVGDNKVLVYKGRSEVLTLVYKLSSVTCLEEVKVLGTADGKVLFFNKDWELIREVEVGEERVQRLSVTSSNFVIAVVGKYDVVVLDPSGKVVAHQSYRWDLNKVRWSPDLKKMLVFEDGKTKLLEYDEKEMGYVKIDEMEGKGQDAKWCDGKMCLLLQDLIYIYEGDVKRLHDFSRMIKVSHCNYCTWSPDCRGIALLGKKLFVLTSLG